MNKIKKQQQAESKAKENREKYSSWSGLLLKTEFNVKTKKILILYVVWNKLLVHYSPLEAFELVRLMRTNSNACI